MFVKHNNAPALKNARAVCIVRVGYWGSLSVGNTSPSGEGGEGGENSFACQ